MENGIDYLNSLGLHKVIPGLDRIYKLLKSFDNPQDQVPGIIIAGTNGKGSVASAITSILSAQGYKVGLYTSPHLINITERITINGVEINRSDLSSIIFEIKKSSESVLDEVPSYFEVITAAAYLYFARNSNDINVLEVGMGGRWDATNVITPLASVITNISKDHSEYLGDTIPEIAAEKACIIKPSVPVVTAAENEALKVIKQEAERNNSPLYVRGIDFRADGDVASSFSYVGTAKEYNDLRSNLGGEYQLVNLSLAIATIEALSQSNKISVDESSLRNGLLNINWQGRFEMIREEPPLILDGAHNPGAAKALVRSLSYKYPETKFTVLLAMLDDKDHEEFIIELAPITEKILITKAPSERSSNTNKLAETSKKYINDIEIIEDYESAYEAALKNKKPCIITGSIYLIGAIKNLVA